MQEIPGLSGFCWAGNAGERDFPLTFGITALPPPDALFPFDALGQTSLGGFAVKGGEVVPGLVHDFDDLVERNEMGAVGECGVDIGVEGPGGGDGVALDARHLYQPAHGVAREPEVVLQPHFGGVLDLRGGAAEELARSGGGHGAGDAHFALATDLGARYRRIGFGDIAEQPGGSQRPQDTDAEEIARSGQW